MDYAANVIDYLYSSQLLNQSERTEKTMLNRIADFVLSGTVHRADGLAASGKVAPLSKVATIPIDPSVNQCQGFAYNSKKDVFVLACINNNNTKQIVYELDPKTFAIVGTYPFSNNKILAHMNTLTYNAQTNRLYTTNAVVTGYEVTPIYAETMIVEKPLKVQQKIFNLAYDSALHQYVSIVPTKGGRMRIVNIYDNNFNLVQNFQIDGKHPNLNNNGAYRHNGKTIFTTLDSFVTVNRNGSVESVIPYQSGMEVEDLDDRNGIIYAAVNRNGAVEIYRLGEASSLV